MWPGQGDIRQISPMFSPRNSTLGQMKLVYEIRFEEGGISSTIGWPEYDCWLDIYHLPLVDWMDSCHIQPTDRYVFCINHIQPFKDPRLRREIASVPRSTLERLLEGESLWCVWKLGHCRHIRQPDPTIKKSGGSCCFSLKVRVSLDPTTSFRLLWQGILRFLRLEAFRLPKWIFWKVKVWLLLRSRDFSEVHIPCKGKRSESR